MGSTSEGFKGDVLIYSGTEKVDFSKLTRSDIESKFPVDIDTYDDMKISNTERYVKRIPF